MRWSLTRSEETPRPPRPKRASNAPHGQVTKALVEFHTARSFRFRAVPPTSTGVLFPSNQAAKGPFDDFVWLFR
jgi:hypothetical protein